MGVTLITPTGGRPDAFRLCERWMSNQTYKGPLDWVVVDDCDPPTACTKNQIVIRPNSKWYPGRNTQCQNLLLAIPEVKSDHHILIIEDDDYYGPGYIDLMISRLVEAPLVGEMHARYYNVRERAYHYCTNSRHSSLAQTGFRYELLPEFESVVSSGVKYVDMALWKHPTGNSNGKLFQRSGTSIGIKGMPGRPGIGVGHERLCRNSFMLKDPPWKADFNLQALRDWIGDDALAYVKFYVMKRLMR